MVFILFGTYQVPFSFTQSQAESAQHLSEQALEYLIGSSIQDSTGIKWYGLNIDGVNRYDVADIAWGQLGPATALLEAYQQTREPRYLDYAVKSANYIASIKKTQSLGVYYWMHGNLKLSPDVARVGDFMLKMYESVLETEEYGHLGSIYLDCALGAAKWLAIKAEPDDNGLLYFKYYPGSNNHGIAPGREAMTASFFLHLHQTIGTDHLIPTQDGVDKPASYYVEQTINWLLSNLDKRESNGGYYWEHNRPFSRYNPPPLEANGWIAHFFFDCFEEFGNQIYLENALGIVDWILSRQIHDSEDRVHWIDLLVASQGTTAAFSVPFDDVYFRVAPEANNLLLRANQHNRCNPVYLEASVKYANWLDSISVTAGTGRKIPYYAGSSTYNSKDQAIIINYLTNLCDLDLSQVAYADVTKYEQLASDLLIGLSESAAPQNGGIVWQDGTTHGYYMWMATAGTAYHLITSNIQAPTPIVNWSETTSIPSARRHPSTFIHNDHIYLIGGDTQIGAGTTGQEKEIYYSDINQDYSLGNWIETENLGIGIDKTAPIVYNDRAYLIAGTSSGGPEIRTVYYTTFNSDGSLQPWSTTTPLPQVTTGHTAEIWNDYIYVIGGWNGASSRNTVYKAQINENGEISSWTTTASLPSNRWYHTSFVYENWIYVIGGLGFHDTVNTVYRASINPDGSLNPWVTLSPLDYGINSHESEIIGNQVLLIGGSWITQSNPYDKVLSSSIDNKGELSIWEDTGFDLPLPLAKHATESIGSMVYVVGGIYSENYDHSDKIYYRDTSFQSEIIADYSWSPTQQSEGNEIQFTDISTSQPNPITSWFWDFGDGTTSTDQNSLHTFMDNGGYSVSLTVTDVDGSTSAVDHTVIICDLTPDAEYTWSPDPQTEGCQVNFVDASTSSPDDIVEWSWNFAGLGVSSDRNPVFTFMEDGDYSVSLTITDEDGSSSNVSHLITVNDEGPSAEFIWEPIQQNEGYSVKFTDHSESYPDDLVSWEWNFAGLGTSSEINPEYTFLDNGDWPVTLTVTDEDGSIAQNTQIVSTENIDPVLASINAPIDPKTIGDPILVSVDFSDSGTLDTHMAVWYWGDNTSSIGTVIDDAGTGTVYGSHQYSTPGVFEVSIILEDDDGGSDNAIFQYVVIYDPEGGFVTGGGWIDSPMGALAADPNLTGKASFGFVSKYRANAELPDGKTQFLFKVADLHFKSIDYQWLVVAGNHAKFKGSGMINGEGNYGFMITGTDSNPDTFRIRIWDKATDETVYDNIVDSTDDSYEGTALSGGSIVVH